MNEKTKISKILSVINFFKSWQWQNLAVLAVTIIAIVAILAWSGSLTADAEKIDALNKRIEALQSTIVALTVRLESYEKLLDYRIDNIEQKIGIKYTEGNGKKYLLFVKVINIPFVNSLKTRVITSFQGSP